MSDAISKAIEAMDMARSAVGPFSLVVTKKLTESIEALQALQSGEPVLPEWIKGAPEVGTYAILHVPCKGYPNYCVIGFLEDDGAVYDMCGDELGVYEDDIERWTKLPALLSAGKENNNE